MGSAFDHSVQQIVEHTGDVLIRVDRVGTIIYASPSVATFGYTPEDIVGKTGFDLIHPLDRERVMQNTAALLRGEVVPDAERRHRLRRADGSWVWIEGAPKVLTDDAGEVVGFVNAMRDITTRQEAEIALRASENRLRLITESSPDIILQTDLQGRLVFISPAVRTLGFEPDSLIGTNFGALIHPEDRPRAAENRRRTLQGEPVLDVSTRTNRYRTADGGWVWLQGNPRALHDETGQITGTVNVLRDVTVQREQSELFEAAFEHAAIGKALVGLDGRFLRVNQAFFQMLGYSQAELLDLDFQTLTHPEDLTADLDLATKLTAGEIDSYVMDKRYLRKDGEPVWVRLSGSMVRNVDGTPKHYIAQVQDRTDQRRAEQALRESEARHRVIGETTADVITMATMDGTLTFVSPSIRQLGYEPEALIGSRFTQNVHPDDLPATWRSLKAMIAGAPSERLRWRARHGVTGEWRWLESAPSLARDAETGAPTGLIDVVRDISRQVEQEEALKAAQAAAEAATAVKAQFVANMSHEIRNPLTAVLGFADVLRRSATLEASDRLHVERIASAGSALLAIVNDILDFSKLESGMVTISPRPTEIAKVAQESLALFERQAADKGIDLVFETDDALPATVALDGARLRQILINIIANAVKFTDAGKVSLRVTAVGGDEVRFEVSDTGPGLSDADCARLFQRFSQIDGAGVRRHGGTGLGLAICKGLVDAMDGAIGVESAPGMGSTFHLTLPFARIEAVALDAASVDVSPMEGLRVLVVEDNAANRELATLLLEALGVEVSTAESGTAALDRLAAQPFDAVLLDIRLPDLDGPEVLRRLRETPGPNQRTPTLAFTAEPQGDGAAIRQGFDGVVGKPIDTEAFVLALVEAVPWAMPDRGDPALRTPLNLAV